MKQWRLPVSVDPGFRTMKSAGELRAVGMKSAGELRVGFYIRVEGGMSEYTHCRVIQDLYRTRYTPEHPQWKDSCIHGTDKKFAQSIIDSGLICGGVQRKSADKRAEVHLVNALVGNGVKTAGVRKGSNAYVKLNAKQMYDDGIVMYISEESEVIFTKGEPRGGQEVIDP